MKLSRNVMGWAGSGLGFGVLGLAALAVVLSPAALADDAGQAASAARLGSVDGQVQSRKAAR